MKKELYLGLDVHKDCIATAVAESGRTGEVRNTGELSNDLQAVEKWEDMPTSLPDQKRECQAQVSRASGHHFTHPP